MDAASPVGRHRSPSVTRRRSDSTVQCGSPGGRASKRIDRSTLRLVAQQPHRRRAVASRTPTSSSTRNVTTNAWRAGSPTYLRSGPNGANTAIDPCLSVRCFANGEVHKVQCRGPMYSTRRTLTFIHSNEDTDHSGCAYHYHILRTIENQSWVQDL